MNNKLLINYTPGDTVMHKLTGGTKVALFFVYIAAVIATFDIRILLLLLPWPIIAIISMKPNYKPILAITGFTFLTVNIIGKIMQLVITPEAGLQYVGGNTILWQPTEHLYLSVEWLWYTLVSYVKWFCTMAGVFFFLLSTTPSEFASGLAKLKVPYKICTIVAIAYRCIPDIAAKFIDIRKCVQMRGIDLSKNAKLWYRLKNNAALLVPVIITSFGNVNNMANAMDLRGYGHGKRRTWYAEHELTRADKILRVVTALFLIGVLAYILFARILYPYPVKMWCPFLRKEDLIVIEEAHSIFDLFKN